MYELFIAKRYLRSKHKINFIGIISTISTVGITIGVAALVVVISVFNGFGTLVTDLLVNFDPHVRIIYLTENSAAKTRALEEYLTGKEYVKSFSPYLEGKTIILNEGTPVINKLKGIDPKISDWGAAQRITFGEFNINDSTGNKIILSIHTALGISARIGENVNTVSLKDLENTAAAFALPKTNKLELTGIFETAGQREDSYIAFTSINTARKVLGIKNGLSGIEIRMEDFDKSELLKDELIEKFGTEDFSVQSWYDLHKDLYDVMQVERWGAFILLLLIITVATFNILGSLTMTVMEKKKDIAVMRSMGVTRKSILRIFLFEGMLIGTIGTLTGLSLGLIVCWLQMEFNFYPLDPTKYVIDAMPVKIQFIDILVITFFSLLLSYFSALYPANGALKLNLMEAIKWE